MPILPEQFPEKPSLELLREAEAGLIGFDHRLIRRLLATPDETIEALETMAEAPADDRLVDLDEQVFDLFRHFRTPRAIPHYLALLEGREFAEIPDALVEAFAELGEDAVEPLLEYHACQDEATAGDVVFLLATLGKPDARIRALIEATIDADPYEGSLCASLSRDRELRPALDRALAGLSEEHEHERKAVQDALAEINSEAEIEPSEPPDIWSMYPAEALPVFEALPESNVIDFFSSPLPEHRAAAVASMVDTDYEDETRDALLQVAQSDPDPVVRGTALAALGERLNDEGVSELLEAALSDKSRDLDERKGALLGLAANAGRPTLEPFVREFYERPEARSIAIEAMYRSLDPRYAPQIVASLTDEDAEVRRSAIRGVGIFGIEPAAIELVPLFQDAGLREDALYSYALAAPGKTTEKSVHRLYEEIEQKADGLTPEEGEAVASALDRRLERDGLEPVFFPNEGGLDEPVEQLRSDKIGRNDPCPCGSGKKYK